MTALLDPSEHAWASLPHLQKAGASGHDPTIGVSDVVPDVGLARPPRRLAVRMAIQHEIPLYLDSLAPGDQV